MPSMASPVKQNVPDRWRPFRPTAVANDACTSARRWFCPSLAFGRFAGNGVARIMRSIESIVFKSNVFKFFCSIYFFWGGYGIGVRDFPFSRDQIPILFPFRIFFDLWFAIINVPRIFIICLLTLCRQPFNINCLLFLKKGSNPQIYRTQSTITLTTELLNCSSTLLSPYNIGFSVIGIFRILLFVFQLIYKVCFGFAFFVRNLLIFILCSNWEKKESRAFKYFKIMLLNLKFESQVNIEYTYESHRISIREN